MLNYMMCFHQLCFIIDALATELIVEFLVNSNNMNSTDKNNGAAARVVDVENPEAVPPPEPKSKKSLALKILALKCAAHLKWNFQLLENRYKSM